jgi:PASTA domain
MALRPRILLPRLALAVLVVLLATATITFAAETRGGSATPTAAEPTAPGLLLVPDVRRQAYVFAKTSLEENGFAWRVAGSVRGYSANLVVSQSPAPGTRVVDTGAPTVVLTLAVNPRYGQEGLPENASPYPGTELRLLGLPEKPKPQAAPKPKPKPAAKPKAKPKPAAKSKARPKPKAKPAAKPKPAAQRPAEFLVPGAKREPLDEMPLPARAALLRSWLAAHPRPTDANVRHWLYQHAWIVTGARLGWWHGAAALESLIAVDRMVERRWGIGHRSERAARAALAEVRRKAR